MKKSSKWDTMLSIMLALFIGSYLIITGCNEDDDDDDTNNNDSVITTRIQDGGTIQSVSTENIIVEVDEDATVTIAGQVKFSSGTTLKINPGVTVKGDIDYFSYLIIDRGAKIEAIGTAEKPITFTSGKPEGERTKQDWGGIVINGYAPINAGETALGEGDSGPYGGNNPEDNSGTLKYVRIMFAGKAFNAEDELNGLCLQGVGSGTTIDYIQIHNCFDDGIEMFGGTVNLKHIIATGNGDDQIDCTYGWQGKIQFAISVSLPGNDSNFEHDNNGSNFSATPVTNVRYYNVTCLRGDGADERGARMRCGTQAFFYNSYFSGSQADRAIISEDAESKVTFDNVLIEQNGDVGYISEDGGVLDAGTNLLVDDDPANPLLDITNVASYAALELNGADTFVPDSSATNAGAVTTATPPNDGFYDTSATYIGAVENASNNWAQGWTEFPEN
ncbi:MAG: hypothetical protein SVR08_14600 [Spirochaetota bacterium]|nr:hypothetical protein [Spirochaetota bacterium]